MSVSQLLAYISVSSSVSSPVSIFVFVNVGLGWRPRSPCAWQRPKPSPSLDMPTSKHFCSRQYWQRLRVTLLIWQFLSRWQVYTNVLLNTATEETLQQTSNRERVGQLKSRSTTIISHIQAVSILFKVADPEQFLLMMSFCFWYIKG